MDNKLGVLSLDDADVFGNEREVDGVEEVEENLLNTKTRLEPSSGDRDASPELGGAPTRCVLRLGLAGTLPEQHQRHATPVSNSRRWVGV